MPRQQPSQRATAGAPPPSKVRMRRDANGNLVAIEEPRELVATTEAAERPPVGEDPRSAAQRNIPPYGAGV